MFIREMSDIHLEFGYLNVPVLPDEGKMTLVLSGDIGVIERIAVLIQFLEEMTERHAYVLMIFGNHEHYGGSLQRSYQKLKDATKHLDNLFILENEVKVIDDVAFIGATLWTDCNKGNHITMHTLEQGMNDYRTIRNGPPSHPYERKLRAIDTAIVHKNTVLWLFPEILKQKDAGNKVVVFTHHAPSVNSIHEMYKHDYHFNGGYASMLEEQIFDTCPDLWFHGHTHTSFDYTMGVTRIICNPRGYFNHEENYEFNPSLVIEI